MPQNRIQLKSYHKEGEQLKAEETLARTVVTLETERIKLVQSLMSMMMMMMMMMMMIEFLLVAILTDCSPKPCCWGNNPRAPEVVWIGGLFP